MSHWLFNLKFNVYLLIFVFENDGRISPFLEWLHSLAHRCSLWKHKCWIPSYSERSRRQLQSKGRQLWKDWRFHYSSLFCLDYFEKLQRISKSLIVFLFFFIIVNFVVIILKRYKEISLIVFLFFQNNITPLHVASRWGKPNMVTLLLDNHGIADERTRVCIWIKNEYCI